MIGELASRVRAAAGAEAGVVVLREVGSTNDLARRIIGEYVEDGARQPRVVVVALAQRAGRGRVGRRWESPAGTGLYCSMLRALPAAAGLSVLPLALAVALVEALSPFLPQPPRLKWPNDLLVPEGKVAGVLVEVVRRGPEVHGVVGIGVNVASSDELPSVAATLGGGRLEPSLAAVAEAVVAACWNVLAEPVSPAQTLESWQAACVHRLGDRLSVDQGNERVVGHYRGLADDGRLKLEIDGATQLVASGDVVEEWPG